MFFHLCEVVQIFQRESIFCNKISSGGSLFITKLVPGGTNFGGSIFTMTGHPSIADTHDITDNSESPDCLSSILKQPLNSGHVPRYSV